MAPPKIYDDPKGPLTHEELLRVLSYDPETGEFHWVRDMGPMKSGDRAGTANGRGYLVIRVKDRLYMAHVLAWFYVTGTWPTKFIDHRDTDRSNNRFSNLREASRPQNGWNSNRHSHSTSPYKGIYRWRRTKRWAATIAPNGMKKHLGVFDTPEEAHAAYAAAAGQHYGEFARS